jgi:hypothetical protein
MNIINSASLLYYKGISLKYIQQDARFSQSIYFYKIAPHVSGGFSAHYQEHKTVHTASGIVKTILLPAAIVDEIPRLQQAAVLV